MQIHQPANANKTADQGQVSKTRNLTNQEPSHMPLLPSQIMQLQKSIGNRAVTQLLKSQFGNNNSDLHGLRKTSIQLYPDSGRAPASNGVLQLAWVPLSVEGKVFFAVLCQYLANSVDLAAAKLAASQSMPTEANPVLLEIKDLITREDAFDAGGLKGLKGKADNIKAHEMEHAEGGHSLARHGPEISDASLMTRLFTGIAPDNKLSPAPGSSSQFISYEAVLETRQAAAAAINAEIVKVQAKVLEWKRDVKTNLAQAVVDKRAAQVVSAGVKTQSETDLATHRSTDLKAKKTREAELTQERETILDELQPSAGMFEDTPEPMSDGPEKDALEAKLVLVNEQIRLHNITLEVSIQEEKRLSDLVNAKTIDSLTAQAKVTTAEAELAHPGKSLKSFLTGTSTMLLEVDDTAGTSPFQNTVQLIDQYSIVIENNKKVGKGFEGKSEISLTAVFDGAAADKDAVDPVPKAKGDIKTALQGLGITEDLDLYVDFLAVQANLKAVKAKGAKGGSIYKTAEDGGDLTQSFTNYTTGSKEIFDGSDAPLGLNATSWHAIQHFPVKDGTLGIKEKA